MNLQKKRAPAIHRKMAYCTAQEDSYLHCDDRIEESWKGRGKRDGATRRRTGAHQPREKRRNRRDCDFDSTLGYPGEGHMRGRGRGRGGHGGGGRRCHRCGQVGHVAARCAAAVAGEAGDAADEAKERELDEIDPLVPVPHAAPLDPEEIAAAAAEEEARKKAEKLARVRADLLSKASTMLLLRNPSNPEDRANVVRSMTAIARSSNTHDLTDDTSQLMLDTYDVALNRVVRQRTIAARMLAIRGPMTAREGWSAGICGDEVVLEADVAYTGWRRDPLEEMKRWEAQRPLSVYSHTVQGAMAYGAGSSLRRFTLAAVEEIGKRAISTIIAGAVHNFLWPNDRNYQVPGNSRLIAQDIGEAVTSLAAGAIEARLYKQPSQFVPRALAHFALMHASVGRAAFYHWAWNSSCPSAWSLRLDLSERHEDLSYDHEVVADVCCNNYPMKRKPVQDGYVRVAGEPDCKIGFGCRRLWGVKGYVPTVFRNCIHNEEISMDGRVGQKLPAHSSPAQTSAVVKHWKKVIDEQIDDIDDKIQRVRRPIPRKEWALSFPPAKRDMFLQMFRDGFDEPRLTAKSFIKRELAVKPTDNPQFKDPRFIQGCPVELSALTGPSLRVLAKNVRQGLRPKHGIAGEVRAGRQIVYTCGMSAEAVGQEFRKAIDCITEMLEPGDEIVFLEDDQSRFDLHLLEGPFKALARIYHKKLGRRVARLLRRGKSVGRTNLGTKYSIPWTMQSGWPDTSVGDTLINAIMKRHIHGIGRAWISIICGDDSVTVTTRKEIERLGGLDSIIAEYAKFGMEVEALLRTNALDVEFCSSRFLPHKDSFVLFPKVGKILAKLCWDQVDRNEPNQKAWLRGICSTLEHYGKLDPLLEGLAFGLRQSLGEGKIIVQQRSEYKHWLNGTSTMDPIALSEYYAHHYQLSPTDISRLSLLLRHAKVGDLCDDSLLAQVVERDT